MFPKTRTKPRFRTFALAGLKYVRRFQYGWLADEDYDDFCHFQCHLSADLIYDFVKQMPDVEELLIFALFTKK